jgi:hypothetical protein
MLYSHLRVFNNSQNAIINIFVYFIYLLFFTQIVLCMNGGREMAHEIIKKSEKYTHDARVEARRVEEATEREKRIGIAFCLLASAFIFVASD